MNAQFSPKRRPLTVAGFHGLVAAGELQRNDRVELINGEMMDMAPIGPAHASCTDRLVTLLVRTLSDAFIVRAQNPLQLNLETEVYPDVCVVRHRAAGFATSNPGPEDLCLLIEVSDTTLVFDRQEKLRLYAANGVPEVWIVDVRNQAVLTFAEPDSHQAIYNNSKSMRTGALTCALLPALRLSVSQIFA
jgi:Uma2 family endonuclease